MALLCLLAILMSIFLPRLQSLRMSSGMSHEVHGYGHSAGADVTIAGYDQKFFACEQKNDTFKDRFIFQAKDKPLMDYLFSLEQFSSEALHLPPLSGHCKPFALPQSPSSMLQNLTAHTLPEDIMGLIGNFLNDEHCTCVLSGFDMAFLEKCKAVSTPSQWRRVNKEVEDEGGSCLPRLIEIETNQALQTCMALPKENQLAVCDVSSDEQIVSSIKSEERKVEEAQEVIKKQQENIKDSQDVLDILKQKRVFLKQIFDGP